MPLVCDKLSIRLKEQGLRKYDLRKDKIIGMSALGKSVSYTHLTLPTKLEV